MIRSSGHVFGAYLAAAAAAALVMGVEVSVLLVLPSMLHEKITILISYLIFGFLGGLVAAFLLFLPAIVVLGSLALFVLAGLRNRSRMVFIATGALLSAAGAGLLFGMNPAASSSPGLAAALGVLIPGGIAGSVIHAMALSRPRPLPQPPARPS